MICTNCQTENPKGARFCFNCGAPFPKSCSNCGAQLPSEARFCHNCGKPVPLDSAVPASDLDLLTQPTPSTPDLITTTDRLIRRYLPEELLAKLESARNNNLMAGERRVVTILFCDVQGSTEAAVRLDPEEWAEIINGAFEHMIQPIYNYEGTVARLQGDGILAFFGAPIAHEDDPERAVLAGLEIINVMQPYAKKVKNQWGIGLNVRVGINTGLVVLGEVGTDLRVEYTALGDAVNLAARMEQNASPGSVLISAATYRLVALIFDFEIVENLQLKGYQESIIAYRPVRRKSQPRKTRGLEGLTAPLIGRQEALHALRSAFDELKLGRGQIISVIGEAGLGKSRLLSEFHQTLSDEDQPSLHWLEGRTLSYQTGVPFAPIISLFSRFFNQDSGDSHPPQFAHIVERLNPHFGDRTDEVAPFFASLLGTQLDEQEAERVKYIPPPQLRAMLFTHTKSLLEHLLNIGPVALFLDDLHWADPSSIEMLQALLPLTDSSSLMVIAAFRPRRSEPSWDFHIQAERSYSHRYHLIHLQPLSNTQSRELISSLLEIDDLPEKVRTKILDKSEGNPFFVEEVIRSLLDNKLIVKHNERWQVTREIDNIDLPDTLLGVITARLDRLTESTRHVLQAASVLGREFSAEILAEISPEDEKWLEEGLIELVRRELVHEKRRQPQRVFSFKHILTQEAAYNSILLSHRRELHRSAADAIITHSPDAAAEIARHLLKARLSGRAVPYLVQAGEQANRAYAIEEAIGYFRQVLEAKDEGVDISVFRRAYEGLGSALIFANRIPEAQETYKQMVTLAESSGDIPMKISAINKLASVAALNMGQFQEAEILLAQADQLSEEYAEKSGIPDTNLLRCQMCAIQGDFENVVVYMDEVVKTGYELGNQEYVSMGMDHVASSLIYLTKFEQAQKYAEEGLQATRQVGDRVHEASLLSFSLPFSALHQGNLELAEQYLSQGLEIATRIGHLELIALSTYFSAEIAGWRGEYQIALDYGQRAMDAAQPIEEYAPYVLAPILGLLGKIYLEISPKFNDKIIELHQYALRLLESPFGVMTGGLPWADLGLCGIEIGDQELAQAVLEKGLNTPNSFHMLERPRILAGMAMLSRAQGKVEKALDLADQARAYAEEHQLHQHYPLTALIQGRVRAAAGQPELALSALDQAKQESRVMRMRPILWQAHAKSAEMLTNVGRIQEAKQERIIAEDVVAEIASQIENLELRQAFFNNVMAKIPVTTT
jgi:class 3 adenylate cyclase/tetratricopeptide (TPR) repeat protein